MSQARLTALMDEPHRIPLCPDICVRFVTVAVMLLAFETEEDGIADVRSLVDADCVEEQIVREKEIARLRDNWYARSVGVSDTRQIRIQEPIWILQLRSVLWSHSATR